MSILSDAFLATDAELAATQFEGSGGPIAFFPTHILIGMGVGSLQQASNLLDWWEQREFHRPTMRPASGEAVTPLQRQLPAHQDHECRLGLL